MSIAAIITARGGSKGLPKKHERLLGGKPLLAWTVEAAKACPRVGAVLVTTDDPALKALALGLGAELIDRPAELATDEALSVDVLRHALSWLDAKGRLPEHFVLLQPTSPLRTAAHLTECLDRFEASGAKSAVSVTAAEPHPYKALRVVDGRLEPLFDEASLHMPRQKLPKVVQQNGAIYVAGARDFLEGGPLLPAPVMPYEMPRRDSVDIDTEFDLLVAEQALRRTVP